jgi:hypothetical protein
MGWSLIPWVTQTLEQRLSESCSGQHAGTAANDREHGAHTSQAGPQAPTALSPSIVPTTPPAVPPWSRIIARIRAGENVSLVSPKSTGKTRLLIALGLPAVGDGRRVRYFSAADLVNALYRGLADNRVGRVIESVLRADQVVVGAWQSRAAQGSAWGTCHRQIADVDNLHLARQQGGRYRHDFGPIG